MNNTDFKNTTTNKFEVGGAEWIYPYEQAAPRNKKLHVLTKGGISILAFWVDNMGYMAWSPLHKRNQVKEEIQAKLNNKYNMQ